MEFKARVSNIFIMNMFMIALAFGMAAISFLAHDAKHEFFVYVSVLWLIIGFLRLSVYWRYIYLVVYNKTVFVVSESYIFDGAKKIKYYWKDIDEIYDDNAYLYIELYRPKDYLHYIKNPLKKLNIKRDSNPYKTPFTINLDMVNINQKALLAILDDYSVKELTDKA